MSSELIVQYLPMDSITPDPNQPRKKFDENDLKELAETIRQHGLLNPILVRPVSEGKYELVHGERRFRACKLLGLTSIKAEVRSLDDKEKKAIQLIENLQRKDLNPIEEAEMLLSMLNEIGYTHQELGEKIGKSREYVSNMLRLLKLPVNLQRAVIEGKVTPSQIRPIISIKDAGRQQVLADQILTNDLSARDVEELVSRETYFVKTESQEGQVIGVYVDEETYLKLSKTAEEQKTSVEAMCSRIIAEVIKC